MGTVLSVPCDNEVLVQETLLEDTTPTTSPLMRQVPWAPQKRSAAQHLLFLDVQTTTDDPPQLLSLDAVLYVIDEGTATKGESLSAIIRPRRAYSVMRHMQDVRAHGIPAEVLGKQGQAAAMPMAMRKRENKRKSKSKSKSKRKRKRKRKKRKRRAR
jgi:hypothetical protein